MKICYFDGRKRNFIYFCCLEMTFNSDVVSEKSHFLSVLPLQVCLPLLRTTCLETALTRQLSLTQALKSSLSTPLPNSTLLDDTWSPEREHCRSTHTMEICKHFKRGLVILESQLLNIHQDTTVSMPIFKPPVKPKEQL